MNLYNDISPQTIVILAIIVVILFAIVVYVIFRDTRKLEKAEEEHDQRVRQLRFGDMLDHLNIPLKKYDHKTSDLVQEMHIWRCEHCPDPESCEHFFAGEDIDPNMFCPNYEELKKIKEKL